MIQLENVTKRFDNNIALDDINFTVEPGEFVFIVGESGAGKSTLFKLLIKELQPSSGKIIIDGKNVTKLRRREIPALRRSIGVVFQDFRLLKDRNIYDNIAFAQRAVSVRPSDIKKNVSAVLTECGIASLYRHFPSELSGGEQQRAALARAIVNRPKILLADEPTGNLDPENARAIMDLLSKINENGTTVLVVTHNLDMVRIMNKRVLNLKNGIIVNDILGGGLYEN